MNTNRSDDLPIGMDGIAQERLEEIGRSIIMGRRLAMVLTNPNRPDNPIIYVNRAFETVTGYSREAAIGRNCRFLQGNDRNQPEVDRLRRAIEDNEPVTVELRNYTADGEMFMNRLIVAPIENDKGERIAFMGVQMRVIDANSQMQQAEANRMAVDHLELLLRETNQRVRSHLSLLSSLIRAGDPEPSVLEAELLAHRVDALSLLYDDLSSATSGELEETISAGEYISRIVATLSTLSTGQRVRFDINTDYCLMGIDRAALVGLIVSEVVSAVLAQARDRDEHVHARVGLSERMGNSVTLAIESDAPARHGRQFGLVESQRRIVEGLSDRLGGQLYLSTRNGGASLTLDFGAMH